MIYYVISVKDLGANAFTTPNFTNSLGIAVREFKDIINQSDHAFHKHPDDYELYVMATFDDNIGVFKQDLRCLVRGADVATHDYVKSVREVSPYIGEMTDALVDRSKSYIPDAESRN